MLLCHSHTKGDMIRDQKDPYSMSGYWEICEKSNNAMFASLKSEATNLPNIQRLIFCPLKKISSDPNNKNCSAVGH
ncbi:hypothetical protein CUMW_129050 [Citrus unshiu]|nr:hypothetical protein CUMW_129050 [Citrus unshiu]